MQGVLQKIREKSGIILIKILEKIIFPIRNYFSRMEMESYGWKVKKDKLWGFEILIPPTNKELEKAQQKNNIFTNVIVVWLITLIAYTFIYFLS